MRSSLIALSCTAALLLLSGCEKEKTSPQTDITEQKAAITTVLPEFGNFSTQITATASVQPSPDGIVSMSAPVSGSIDKINVTIGDRVTKGSPLLSVRSTDVSDAQSDQLSAKAAYAQAKHVYDMNKELFKLGAITANELAQSQSNLQQADAMEKGYSQKLNYYGASSGQTLMLRSPIDGIVYEIGTHLGEKVGNGADQPMIKIADPRKKIIVATVYEKDIFAFYPGKQVNITVENQDMAPITGKVTYVSDVLDPENKTTKIYIQPSSDTSKLKINMFVNVSTQADKKEVFRIPKKALLYREGKFAVYIQKGSQFVPMNVTLVSDDPQDNFSLVKGLPQNTPIALEAISLERQ